jgi:ribosomal protein L11 methyltransferase
VNHGKGRIKIGEMAVNAPNGDPPQWVEIAIRIDPVAHEPLGSFLFDLGCAGIVTQDLQDRTLKAYLLSRGNLLEPTRNRIRVFLQDLRKIFPEIQSPRLQIRRVKHEDWGVRWREFFAPERVTPGLTLFPGWEPLPSSQSDHVIRIDPGPAFGTGKHPTTRMCLEAMEKIPCPGQWSLLDVGTGSGILAIYGAKLGAKRVVAVDIDPEALRWARINIELNRLTIPVELSGNPVEKLEGSFWLLTANLTLEDILRLLPHFTRLLDSGGWLIVSGILRDRVEAMEKGLGGYPFCEHKMRFQEEWACLTLKKIGEGLGT